MKSIFKIFYLIFFSESKSKGDMVNYDLHGGALHTMEKVAAQGRQWEPLNFESIGDALVQSGINSEKSYGLHYAGGQTRRSQSSLPA